MLQSPAAEPEYRAVTYMRVSSAAQNKTDHDPDAQRVKCQHLAEQLGLAIVDEYIEPGRTPTEKNA